MLHVLYYLNSKDLCIVLHLRFKQAQPKMCTSPKVENGVENIFFFFCDPNFPTNFVKNFELKINFKPLELLT